MPKNNYPQIPGTHMVLPLVDEDMPKCYVCHKRFEDMEKLKAHQRAEHKELDSEQPDRGPSPGDVTVF